MAEQGSVIVGEEKEQHNSPQIAQDQVEKRARDKGWAPENEWRGPVEDWVDAREFLGRQKLFDRIKDLKDAIHTQKQSFEKDMRVISKAFAEMSEVQYKKALTDLKAQRAIAIEDKDVKAVEVLDEEIDATKQKLADAKKAPQQTQTQESPAFTDWKKDNSWFEENSEMKADAVAIGVGYAAANPNKTEKEIYDYVTKKVKKMYPDEFGSSTNRKDDEEEEGNNKGERKVTNSVESAETSSRPGKPNSRNKSKLSTADLTDDQRQVMKTLIKRNTFKELAEKAKMTQEEYYLQQYQENVERK